MKNVISQKLSQKSKNTNFKNQFTNNRYYCIKFVEQMSIFFASGNISDSEQSENQEIIKNEKIKPTYNFGDDDYDNNDKKRVVQTEKDKKWNLIKAFCTKITTLLNNEDFEKVWDNLQELLKEVEKASKVIEKQGKYPSIFLKTLKKIDEDITAYTTSGKKKLNKNSSTAFNTMRQKLKNKILPQFDTDLKKFIENEEAYSSGDEQEEFESSSDSESESDAEDEDKGDWRSEDIMIRRKYFLKKEKKARDDEDKQRDSDHKDHEEKQKQKAPREGDKKKERFHLSEVHQKKKIEIKSVKQAEAKIKNIISTFHKLTTKDQREEYLDNLNEIVNQSKKYKDFEKLSFLLVDIPIRIEVFRQMKMTHFAREQWSAVYSHIDIIYHILKESEEDDLLENVQLFSENSDEKVTSGQEQTIYKSLQSFLMILQAELRKSFIFLDKSDIEYSDRLQDLIKLTEFMYKVSRDMSFHENMQKQTTELSFKVLENMYYMSENFMNKLKEGTDIELRFTQLVDEDVLQEYCQPILKSRNDQNITKTILYIVFNHAVNQRQKARELLIMSSIPEIIKECDYYTQVMYNRCIVQIGITSFNHGKYFEVQQFLSEICSYAFGKTRDQTKDVIREFLAQGYVRGQQEKQIPKNRILPYYLHLNIDLIESLELIASMILEVPYILSQGGKITSKTFKRIFYQYEKSHFIAEPLNSKDLIFAASCELRHGNWSECYNRLLELEIWRQMENVEVAHKNMLQIIKEYSLKCYLLANSKCFRSLSIPNLAQKFQTEEKIIRKMTSKWIYSRQIQGSINDKGYLILAQKKHSQMQKLCDNLYNKLQDIRKAQEQMMEQRFTVVQEDEDDAEKEDKDTRLNRRFNLAMSDKLRTILSKRT